ncbi:MAG: hypothetical protein LQ339_006114 [Xanthoria mediterranea]|nr:MAG: hypothetical protein LQ339_006114 [Xanthoria mediterranea]
MATNVDAKLLKQTRFPPEFSQKVDMKKVNVEVMKKWIAGKISEILGSEDDVVVELCFNLLEGSRFPDIKVLQIQLTGFLDKDTPKFCKELWTLCLSAQSNPQGVPKELLEAKKLELIQEKPPKKPSAGETRNECGTKTLTTSGKESELSEAAVVEEATGAIMTTIGVHPDTPGLHRHGGNDHHTQMTIVDLHHEITSTPIYLVTGIYGDAIPVLDHLRFDGLPADPYHAQERRPQGVTETMIQDLDVAAPVAADLEHLFTKVMGETGDKELITVVVIELDPIHLQTRLAHDHPEDRDGDAALRYHPAVLLLLQEGHSIANMAVLRHHRGPYRGLVLPRLNEIAGGLADREDLRLLLVMKWMIHALMLVKDKATMTVGVGVAAATGAEAPAYRGSEKGRGVAPYRDMLPLQEDGVTPLQSLHPLKSDATQLILLKKKRTGHPLNPSAEALTANQLLQGGKKRSPTQTANELREKLLREKVLALRKANISAKE